MTFWALFLHWLLVVSGLIYLVSRSAIGVFIRAPLGSLVRPSPSWPHFYIRDWAHKLIYCPACSGFWIGLLCTPFWPYDYQWWWQLFGSAVAAMSVGQLLNVSWSKLGEAIWIAEERFWYTPEERAIFDKADHGEEESEGESDGSE